jgi:hypothetical protein
MAASENGHTEALALLLANRANVNAAMQVIQNLCTFSLNLTEMPLKMYPFLDLSLLLKLEWVYFCYARFN